MKVPRKFHESSIASERGTLYPAQSGGAETESRRECALRRAPKGFGSVARVFARGLHARAPVASNSRSLELSNFLEASWRVSCRS